MELTLGTWDHDRVMAIHDGRVKVPGVSLKCEVHPTSKLFPLAVQEARYDITEMSVSSYIVQLSRGFAFLPVLVGLFAFSRFLNDVRDPSKADQQLGGDAQTNVVRIDYVHSAKVVLGRWLNVVRSSFLGVFVGVLPAAGSTISNILAYDQVKKASKTPEEFGSGATDGIIAPEAANNATAGGALIVMMA